MIKTILTLLRETDLKSENVKIALGKNKFPSNVKELLTYIKLNK